VRLLSVYQGIRFSTAMWPSQGSIKENIKDFRMYFLRENLPVTLIYNSAKAKVEGKTLLKNNPNRLVPM
jgi:hypothetical protein